MKGNIVNAVWTQFTDDGQSYIETIEVDGVLYTSAHDNGNVTAPDGSVLENAVMGIIGDEFMKYNIVQQRDIEPLENPSPIYELDRAKADAEAEMTRRIRCNYTQVSNA